ESLPDDLAHQLGFLDCDAKTRALAEYIIYNLDENGFLKPTLYDLVRDYAGDVTVEDAERALRLVQRLGPPRVAAANLKQALLPPLAPKMPLREVLQTLITNHIDDIGQNRLPAIEKKTGYPLDVIKEAIEALSHLNPRPGARYAAPASQYVIPDLIVEA